jgi:SAM-dependent methyltransferase
VDGSAAGEPTRRAARWDARYADTRNEWSYRPDDLVVELLGSFDPGRALDVGSGTGGNSLWLAQHGWSVTRIDFSPHAIAAARRGAAELGVAAEFLVVDVTRGADLGHFDLVLLNYGLPAPDRGRQAAFTVIDEALTPGGSLLIIDYVGATAEDGGVGSEELRASFGDYEVMMDHRTKRGDTSDPTGVTGAAPALGFHPDIRDDATYSDAHEATVFLATKPERRPAD